MEESKMKVYVSEREGGYTRRWPPVKWRDEMPERVCQKDPWETDQARRDFLDIERWKLLLWPSPGVSSSGIQDEGMNKNGIMFMTSHKVVETITEIYKPSLLENQHIFRICMTEPFEDTTWNKWQWCKSKQASYTLIYLRTKIMLNSLQSSLTNKFNEHHSYSGT